MARGHIGRGPRMRHTLERKGCHGKEGTRGPQWCGQLAMGYQPQQLGVGIYGNGVFDCNMGSRDRLARTRIMGTRDGKVTVRSPTEGDRCYNWSADRECELGSWGGVSRYLPQCYALSVYSKGYGGSKGNRRHSTRDPLEKGRECSRRRDLVEGYRKMGEPHRMERRMPNQRGRHQDIGGSKGRDQRGLEPSDCRGCGGQESDILL